MKKKIYFIRANKTKFGGAEKYLSRFSKALSKKNINHAIINSFFSRFLPSWLRAILFNIQVVLFKGNKFYFSLERITCPDIYRAGDGVHKEFLNKVDKSKINLLHPIYLYLEKRCFENAKHIIANSSMVKSQIISYYGINPDKVSVIYNGIESKTINYQQSYKKLCKEFSIPEEYSILLYVGSGFKRKGVNEFLKIISKLEKTKILAFVIGKEKKMAHYQNLAKKMKINNQVIFTGPRSDVDDFYTISDIFIFPTYYEPFSNVVLEAMNFKNAVFTTRQNGASEIIDDNFIMDYPTDYSTVERVNDLLNNQVKLQKIKDENRIKSKKFTIESNLSETLKIINEVIN